MLKGIALKVGATFAFALMSTLIKMTAPIFPVSEVVFFRSIFALIVLSAWLSWRGEFPAALRTSRPFGHIGRSLAGTGGMFANFVALSLLPLAAATAFTFASPLMIVPLATFVLGEKMRPARAGAVAIGFVGVLVMLSDHLGEGPSNAGGRLGAIVALCGAACTAAAMIQTRRLARSEATGAIVFYFSTVTAVVGLGLLAAAALWPERGFLADAAAGQRFVAPTALEFATLATIGLLGGCGQIMMTHCYRYADASIIAPLDYVAMIWAAALGYMAFGETVSPRIALGAAVVIAAGIGMLWREHEARRINLPSAMHDGQRAGRSRSVFRTNSPIVRASDEVGDGR